MSVTTAQAQSPAEAAAPGEAPKKVLAGFSNVTLRLQSSEQVNHNVKRLRFDLPNGAVSGIPLTSALLTVSWPKGSWFPVLRPYTPVSGANEPGFVDLLVKLYEGGKASTHLHNLAPGDSLRFLVAIPGFKWSANQFPHVTVIAGGQGVTPCYQLIRGILADPADNTKITFVYGANSDQDVLLKAEFDDFAARFPDRFAATYTLSQPVEGSPYRKGRVTKELLEEVMPKDGTANTKVFVSGPPPMEASLCGKVGVLQELGFGKDMVHKF